MCQNIFKFFFNMSLQETVFSFINGIYKADYNHILSRLHGLRVQDGICLIKLKI